MASLANENNIKWVEVVVMVRVQSELLTTYLAMFWNGDKPLAYQRVGEYPHHGFTHRLKLVSIVRIVASMLVSLLVVTLFADIEYTVPAS